VEISGKLLLGNHLSGILSAIRKYPVHGVDDLRAPSVIQRKAEDHAGVVLCIGDRFGEFLTDGRIELVSAANRLQADVVPAQSLEFLCEIFLKKRHQRAE